MAVNYDVNGDGAINSNDRIVNMNDVALAAIDNSASEESMKTNATFNNSTLTGDVLFVSTFNSGFAPQEQILTQMALLIPIWATAMIALTGMR